MPQVIGAIPEFTQDGTPEVKQPGVYRDTDFPDVPGEPGEGKEIPPESSSETKPVEEPPAVPLEPIVPGAPLAIPEPDLNDEVIPKAAFLAEKKKWMDRIVAAEGRKRELTPAELFKVQEKVVDTLEGVNPEDATLVEKVLRAKGYITREESQTMFYEAVKQEELGKFLDKYPEYKPENDANDVNWNTLQREVGMYKMPSNPRQIGEILERSHKQVQPSYQSAQPKPGAISPAVKRQLEVAGVGSGGTQSSTRGKTLPEHYKEHYRRGGWTEEEIIEIEKNL